MNIRYAITGWFRDRSLKITKRDVRKLQERAESLRIPSPRRSPEVS